MIKRELPIFLVVGVLTVLIDFASYRTLVWFSVLNVNTAKAIGFLAGTLFAYFANRLWTFGHNKHTHKPGSLWRFTLLYASTLGANVLTNALALKVFTDISASIQLAFLIATGVSAALNFLGMKFFVFKPSITLELS